MKQNLLYSLSVLAILAATAGLTVSCSVDDDSNPDTPSDPVESYENVLGFFKQINAVPRPTCHEEKMREYLTDFAQKRGLEVKNDHGNIIIYKDATPGMELAPMVCLQTHMDMVCVAAEDYEIDFLTQGVEQYNDGTFIWSKDLSLVKGNKFPCWIAKNTLWL